MPSLLLIEFAVIERFHRAVEFPYLFGAAKARGVPARWIRFGVHASAAFDAGGAGVPLTPEDTATAVAHMDAVDADRVIFSHQPSTALAAALIRGRTDRGVSYTEFALDAIPGVPGVDEAARLDEADRPDFGFIAGNQAAAEMDVLPFLLLGHECTWNRSFQDNPFFEGLDLSACLREGGCSFCARPRNRALPKRDTMERLGSQLRALEATCPTFGGRLRIRLVGEPVINNIHAVAEVILDAGLPASDLLLDSRADTLVRRAEDLRKALATLQDSGHRLHLCLIGIESFSSEALERFNKGIRPADNLAAIRTLLDLEAECPGRFEFREHGGLSLIPYSPWTRPEELDLTQAVLDVLDLTSVAGKHLTGRLRLIPGLPLEVRARADGLLLDGYDDPLLDTARLNFYEDEVPWTFRSPVMEPINRLLVRLDQDEDASGPLSVAVRALDAEARAAGIPHALLAHRIIREALRCAWSGGAVSAEALLDAVSEAVRGSRDSDPAPEFEEWLTREPQRRGVSDGLEMPLERALEIKPVSKIEPLQREDADRWVTASDIPNATLRRREGTGGGPPIHEVFYGKSRRDVERAIALTTAMESGLSADEMASAYREVGELLGYPSCCAAAFAAAPSSVRESYFWFHVAGRVGVAGEVPWELNPLPGVLVEYVPCGLDCGPTLVRARGTLEAMPWSDPSARAAFEASLRNPRMLFHEEQSAVLELIPEDEPGERFRYRTGLRHGGGDDLRALAEGDELEIGPETLLVLRDGRPWASLSGRAFLWWHRRPFQAEFWQAMVDVRRSTRRPVAEAPSEKTVSIPKSPNMAFLDHLLRLFRENAVDLDGLEVRDWADDRGGRIALRLAGGGVEVHLVLDERRDGLQALWEEGPYALSHPADHPLKTDAQWRGARAFRTTLRSALRKLGHPGVTE